MRPGRRLVWVVALLLAGCAAPADDGAEESPARNSCPISPEEQLDIWYNFSEGERWNHLDNIGDYWFFAVFIPHENVDTTVYLNWSRYEPEMIHPMAAEAVEVAGSRENGSCLILTLQDYVEWAMEELQEEFLRQNPDAEPQPWVIILYEGRILGAQALYVV